MKHYFVAITLGFISTVAQAQYRCVENGRTVLTDRPCAAGQGNGDQQPQGKPTNVIGDAANSAYSTTTGGWRGQAQYQANVGGAVSQDAHTVVQLSLEIDPQGKILGSSTENGCKLKGLVSPGFAPTVLSIDVTFSGCGYPGFNRRMSGTFSLYPAQKNAQLALYANSIGIGKAAESFDIRATLRR